MRDGDRYQVLLGVTGFGARPSRWLRLLRLWGSDAGHGLPIKRFAAQLAGELKEFFPTTLWSILSQYYDYYQPEAYLPQSDKKKRIFRRDVTVVASVSCVSMALALLRTMGGPGSKRRHRRYRSSAMTLSMHLSTFNTIAMTMTWHRGTFRVRGGCCRRVSALCRASVAV